jgi:uncharacterized membrane-anchored protein
MVLVVGQRVSIVVVDALWRSMLDPKGESMLTALLIIAAICMVLAMPARPGTVAVGRSPLVDRSKEDTK